MELRSCPIFLLFSSCLLYNLFLVVGMDACLTLTCAVLLPVVLWLPCVRRDITCSEASRTTPPFTYFSPISIPFIAVIFSSFCQLRIPFHSFLAVSLFSFIHFPFSFLLVTPIFPFLLMPLHLFPFSRIPPVPVQSPIPFQSPCCCRACSLSAYHKCWGWR